MTLDVSLLEARYIDSCRKHEVQPNSSILLSFLKVKNQRMCQGQCILEIFLDHLVSADFPPLIVAVSSISLAGIDAIDVHQGSSSLQVDGEYVLSFLLAVNHKLRFVDLHGWSFKKEILRDVYRKGLACQVLDLRYSPIRNLSITGKFLQLQTLNLDFSSSLACFHISCFSCMPKLMHLSMCGSRITNLWMACSALSKLSSLVELRFQNCLCCFDTAPCRTSGSKLTAVEKNMPSGLLTFCSDVEPTCMYSENLSSKTAPHHGISNNAVDPNSHDSSLASFAMLQSTTDESSNISNELDFSSAHQFIDDLMDASGNASAKVDCHLGSEILENSPQHPTFFSGSPSMSTSCNLLEEVILSGSALMHDICRIDGTGYPSESNLTGHGNLGKFGNQLYQRVDLSASIDIKDQENFLGIVDYKGSFHFSPRKYASYHPSPVCFEKYYREYMISSLPCLKVLDNLSVSGIERENAKSTFKKHYEYLPYNRLIKENVTGILQKRELGSSIFCRTSSKSNHPSFKGSSHSVSRSLSAAKFGSSPLPLLQSVSKFRGGSAEETMNFHPRQFEYHPSNPSLMVFGTLDGEIVVVNHESQKLVGYQPSIGVHNSILGLCWLKTSPNKLIAGSDNGSLQLYDICKMTSTITDRCCYRDAVHTFDEFELLTSLNVNSTDEYFITSGFSKDVALYDIGSGKRLQVLKDLHEEHINVARFAHQSPSVFATASFDRKVKMWDIRQGTSRPCYTASSSRGNVMVCFSPDDYYLLASAIDNEVKQLLAVDGRLHIAFNIASIGSTQNYTRAYYMSGRDYVISGSCEENIVRVCCAQTGRRLRDIPFELQSPHIKFTDEQIGLTAIDMLFSQGKGSRNSMFVQSLRGDPLRAFHMSVLAAYSGPRTSSEIIKVNLLSSSYSKEKSSLSKLEHESDGVGG